MTTRGGGLPNVADRAIAVLGMLFIAPLLLVVAVAVAVRSGLPVLFRQQRVGLGGRPFELLKFRSMDSGCAGSTVTARGDLRVTVLGALLRRTKLDELPQLWNVVRGDMALVGPRPEVPMYVDTQDSLWREVLTVRPGLTDPVTLALRDEESLLATAGVDAERFYRDQLLPRKLRASLEYQRARTAWSDLSLLCRTAVAVVKKSDSRPDF